MFCSNLRGPLYWSPLEVLSDLYRLSNSYFDEDDMVVFCFSSSCPFMSDLIDALDYFNLPFNVGRDRMRLFLRVYINSRVRSSLAYRRKMRIDV